MAFQPTTVMSFARTGIDDFNKVVVKSEDELITLCGNNLIGTMAQASFQRADGYFTIRVDGSDIPYYKLLLADTVLYRNVDSPNAFWIFGNILSVEWKNPDCTFVNFKIDHFMTYQTRIDWNSTYAYIEREHVKDDWASDGGNPLFSNIGPAEDFQMNPDTQIYAWTKGYSCDKVVVISPYGPDGKPKFEGENQHGLYSSLDTQVMDPGEVNSFFSTIAESKDASINNIVGVYGIPSEFESAITGRGSPQDNIEKLQSINTALAANPNYPKLNNAKTMSSPFMLIKLLSSDGDELVFNPQWFGSDVNDYDLHICASGAGGLMGGIAAAFNSRSGTFDWKTYKDYMVKIHQLPTCPHTLDGYADWQKVNAVAVGARIVSQTLSAPMDIAKDIVAGAGMAGPVGGIAGGVSSFANEIANFSQIGSQILQARSTGASLGGAQTSSAIFDLGLSGFGQSGGWGFKVIYMSVQPYLLLAVDSFFDRFGYRVAKLKKLELENRPIWTFLKTSECHVAVGDGVPYISELAINSIFNHGVTMWKYDKYIAGRKIGDFSNPSENKGIRGA